MKRKSISRSAFFNVRVLTGAVALLAGAAMALFGYTAYIGVFAQPKPQRGQSDDVHENPNARMAWERLRLQDEHGRISPDVLQRAYEHRKTMLFRPEAWAEFLPKNSMGQPEAVQSIWTSIGPGNIGGRTRSIIIHPTDSNTMWLGAVGGGVWKTTSAGTSTSWSTNTDLLANLAVDCMAIDPTNSNVLYAGTGEGFYPSHGIRGNGIFKTADGGSTWTQLSWTANNPDFYDVTRVAVAPYPQIQGTVVLAATTTGLFRSVDGGFRWSRVMAGPYNAVVFDPNDPTKALASSGLTSLDSIGVFRSTDRGLSWVSSTISSHHTIVGRIELAYARSNSAVVYASADTGSIYQGELLKSTNGGLTFGTTNVLSILDGIGWYANTSWVDPTDSDTLVVGGYNLFRSINGGTSSDGEIGGANRTDHVDHHVVINHPNYDHVNNKTVFVGSDGGIYKTDNILAAANSSFPWVSLNHTLGITQFYGGAASSDGSTIIGGTQDNGTVRYQSQIGSEGWDTALGGDGGFCAAGGGYFYGEAGSYGLTDLWRSLDGSSANLHYLSPASHCTNCNDCVDSSNFNFAVPLVHDPNNASTLFAGTGRLWRSTNADMTDPNAVSWSIIKCPQEGDDNISAIAVAPGFSNIIWVGHNSGRIYMTTNGTATQPSWVRVDQAPLPQRYVESIAFASWRPALYNNVYVAFGGNAYDEGFNPDNLWKTTNGGSTWANISGTPPNNLPSVPVRSIVTSRSSFYPGYLYIGTAVGVFASTDNGGTWSPGIAGDVPANVFVNQLFWADNPSRLVAVTYGRGMFTANAQ
jgi:hypothetical protein